MKSKVVIQLKIDQTTKELLIELAGGERKVSEYLDHIVPSIYAAQADIVQAQREAHQRQLAVSLLEGSAGTASPRQRKVTAWEESEFRTLLTSEHLSDEELAEQLNRSAGAVGVVRVGVRRWRNREDNKGILSKMMIRVLEAQADELL